MKSDSRCLTRLSSSWPRRPLLVFFTLTIASALFAHEEPNKTLWEKQQSQKASHRIVRSAVWAVTTWRQDAANDTMPTQKSKALRQEYDGQGRLALISAYSGDTISASAAYSYGPAGDMISDIDLSASGQFVEANLFSYDREGRVVGGFSCDSLGGRTARFEHRFDPAKRWIEFVKFGLRDSIEYTITYEYPEDFDRSDYAGAVKKTASGDVLLRVEKTLDSEGRATGKTVFDAATQKSISFRYEYAANGALRAISKCGEGGAIESRSTYTFNSDGLHAAMETRDGGGRLMRTLVFEYEYLSDRQQRRGMH